MLARRLCPMIYRHLARTLLAWHGHRDLRRARRELAYIVDVARLVPPWRERLGPAWREYTTRVSTPEMAISLEVAALLGSLCEVVAPRAILDLGSGFSSYVLRSYQQAQAPPPRVKSIDDDANWLRATAAYLATHGLDPGELGSVETLGPADRGAFDLVFHDLGSLAVRRRYLSRALDCARPERGIVLLDDGHKPGYRAAVMAVLGRRPARVYSARALACDGFGRFCLLVTGLAQWTA